MITIRTPRNIARTSVIKPFDPWSSPLCTCRLKYSLHPYTGCSYFCKYCYATSYIGLKPSIPKKNFFEKLVKDLRTIDKKLVVEMSSSSDPYPQIEKWLLFTRRTLKILVENSVKVLITTKSDIVVRDTDLLQKTPSAVMVTITSLDEELVSKIELYAPPPSSRLKALEKLVSKDIPVGIRLDPVIPGLNDNSSNIEELVREVASIGVKHIVTSCYKAKWDNLRRLINTFPHMKSFFTKLYLESSNRVKGYYYLPRELRKKLLKPAVESAVKYGLTIAVCREDLSEYFRAPSCDGQHLIRESTL